MKQELGSPSALSSWSAGTSECGWLGVTCDGSGAVVDVSLQSLSPTRLSGSLPSSLRFVSSLRSVSLDGNAFSGSLPDSWSELVGLEFVSLAGNGLAGVLPPSWSTLRALQELDLSGNGFVSTIPAAWAAGMVSMQYLNLASNGGMCGSVPPPWALQGSPVAGGSTLLGSSCPSPPPPPSPPPSPQPPSPPPPSAASLLAALRSTVGTHGVAVCCACVCWSWVCPFRFAVRVRCVVRLLFEGSMRLG